MMAKSELFFKIIIKANNKTTGIYNIFIAYETVSLAVERVRKRQAFPVEDIEWTIFDR